MLKKAKSEQIVKLYDEQMLLDDLISDTFRLIGRAKGIDPIKLLVEIHDILIFNASLIYKFRSSNLTFDEIYHHKQQCKQLSVDLYQHYMYESVNNNYNMIFGYCPYSNYNMYNMYWYRYGGFRY